MNIQKHVAFVLAVARMMSPYRQITQKFFLLDVESDERVTTMMVGKHRHTITFTTCDDGEQAWVECMYRRCSTTYEKGMTGALLHVLEPLFHEIFQELVAQTLTEVGLEAVDTTYGEDEARRTTYSMLWVWDHEAQNDFDNSRLNLYTERDGYRLPEMSWTTGMDRPEDTYRLDPNEFMIVSMALWINEVVHRVKEG